MIKYMTCRRWVIALFIAALTVATTWLLIHRAGQSDQSIESEQWIPVEPQLIEKHLGLVGRIHAAHQVTLAAPFDAIIREVLVREGQAIEQGQTLLMLDPSQLEIQMRQAQAELLKAQSEVQRLQNWAQSSEVNRARRVVATAKQALRNTESSLQDTMSLFQRGIVARMEVDALRQQQHTQQQELVAAHEELNLLLARGEGDERKITEMELANATARYQALEERHDRRHVKAPINGFIVRPITQEGSKPVILQPGMQVSQGLPLLTIVEQDHFQVLANVEETDLHLLQEGMSVRITGDGFAGHELAGHIASIAIQGRTTDMQSTGARYGVMVSIDDVPDKAKQKLRIGMSARLTIVLYRNEKGMVVPPESLRTDESGETYVLYKASPGSTPKRVNVVLGHSVLQGIEVQGIDAGIVLTRKFHEADKNE